VTKIRETSKYSNLSCPVKSKLRLHHNAIWDMNYSVNGHIQLLISQLMRQA
jgi:hypothetical protein